LKIEKDTAFNREWAGSPTLFATNPFEYKHIHTRLARLAEEMERIKEALLSLERLK